MSMLLGFLAGLLLVIFGIVFEADSGSVVMSALGNFIDYPSMAITFGGCIMAAFMSFPPRYFKDIPKHLRVIFRKQKYDLSGMIDKLVFFAQEARRSGMISMEDKAMKEEDEFLKNSLLLIVDAIEPSKVKDMLDNELNELENRHAHVWSFYEKFATYAPAFGMIGTLIGLINMLANLNMDASSGANKMAQGMAVALVTTFYGSMFANLVLTPIGHRLHMLHDEEMVYKELVVQGVTAILEGETPIHIRQRLEAFLHEKQRGENAKKEGEQAAPAGRKRARAGKRETQN